MRADAPVKSHAHTPNPGLSLVEEIGHCTKGQIPSLGQRALRWGDRPYKHEHNQLILNSVGLPLRCP